MSRTAVDLPLYPGFEGPYSQGATGGGILYTSGQLPFDPKAGRIVDGSVEAQVRTCLQNIERIVVAGGSDMDCVIRCCVFARPLQRLPGRQPSLRRGVQRALPGPDVHHGGGPAGRSRRDHRSRGVRAGVPTCRG